jgi:signal transduction histidine kinase
MPEGDPGPGGTTRSKDLMNTHAPAPAAILEKLSAARDHSADARTRFAFLAETSRCLAGSLDFEATLATGAGLALPHFGTWCMVDIVEEDDTIRRVAVIHPDEEKQRLAREFYRVHPPGRGDPLGAPRVIRTQESEFVLAHDDVLNGIADEAHRALLQELGARSFLMVPMSARGRTLGAITFVSDERREYDDADLLLGEDLGRRCAMAVDNARLYAASQQAQQAAEAALVAATVIAQRTEELLGEANVARHEAEEADRAKTHFLGTISHEFRTPITAMQGFTMLLSDDTAAPLTDTQRHQVERISAASDHLLTLIEEILGFAHQNAGHAVLRLREVDLRDVVRDAGAMVESLAAAKGLQFRLRLPEEPMPFRTDPGKLRQIILNLVANAVKFTDAGEIGIHAESAAGSVLLRISDTGIGIAPQHSEQVFAAFWQVDQSSSRVGGIGLGLAVTRQLAGLLGGEVTMESTPDSGSIFTVRLPLVLPVPDTGSGLVD